MFMLKEIQQETLASINHKIPILKTCFFLLIAEAFQKIGSII